VSSVSKASWLQQNRTVIETCGRRYLLLGEIGLRRAIVKTRMRALSIIEVQTLADRPRACKTLW
jgi:hypothetical protein